MLRQHGSFAVSNFYSNTTLLLYSFTPLQLQLFCSTALPLYNFTTSEYDSFTASHRMTMGLNLRYQMTL